MLPFCFYTMRKSRLITFQNATVKRKGSGLVSNCFIFCLSHAESSASGMVNFFLTWKNTDRLFSGSAKLMNEKVFQERI